jgi:hypothetical protein
VPTYSRGFKKFSQKLCTICNKCLSYNCFYIVCIFLDIVFTNFMLFRNAKVHYSVYKSLQLDPILSHFSLVLNFKPYILKIHFNFVVLGTYRSHMWHLPLRFPNQSIICISHYSHSYSCPSYPPSFYSIICGVKIMFSVFCCRNKLPDVQ